MQTPSGELRLFDGKTSPSGAARRCVVPAAVRYAEGISCKFNSMTSRCSAEGQTVSELLTQLNQQTGRLALNPGRSATRAVAATKSCRKATRSCFSGYCRELRCYIIADKTFDSHLFTGTGKFASSQLMVGSDSRLRQPAERWRWPCVDLRPAQRRYHGAAPVERASRCCPAPPGRNR